MPIPFLTIRSLGLGSCSTEGGVAGTLAIRLRELAYVSKIPNTTTTLCLWMLLLLPSSGSAYRPGMLCNKRPHSSVCPSCQD